MLTASAQTLLLPHAGGAVGRSIIFTSSLSLRLLVITTLLPHGPGHDLELPGPGHDTRKRPRGPGYDLKLSRRQDIFPDSSLERS